MYKRYAALLLMVSLVMGTGWLCVQGVYVDKMAAREAFVLASKEEEEVLRATSYLGVSAEQISSKRILDMSILTRKMRMEVSPEEYENLLRIVEAEAGGEDLLGKMLVANVVLNRVEDERFPDTVSEVIFQQEGGVTQFSPIRDGRFYQVKISEETKRAVDAALRGEDNSKGALYFAARKSADKEKMRWFDEHLDRLFAYGGHEFFS